MPAHARGTPRNTPVAATKRSSPQAAKRDTRALEGKGQQAFDDAARQLADKATQPADVAPPDTPEPPDAPAPGQPSPDTARAEAAVHRAYIGDLYDAAVDDFWRVRGEMLRAPFDPRDIEWRLQQAGVNSSGKPWGKALAYVTARAIMARLDDVTGPGGWRDYYQHGPDGGVMCGIGLRIAGEWLYKWDGAGNPLASGGLSAADSVKGGYSNAFKRAAVKWGIGRYLYDLEEGWVDVLTGDERGYGYQPKREKNGREIPAFHWNPPRLPSWALPSASNATDVDEGSVGTEYVSTVPRGGPPRPSAAAATSSSRSTAAASPPRASAKSTTASPAPKAGAPSGASTASTSPAQTPATAPSSRSTARSPKAKPNAEPGSITALGGEIKALLVRLREARHPRYDELRTRAKDKMVKHPTDHDEWTGIRDALAHLLRQHLGDADQEDDSSAKSSTSPAPAPSASPPVNSAPSRNGSSGATSDTSDPPKGWGGVPNSKINLDARPMVDHVGSSILPACPECGSMMVDERDTKRNPKAPDFRCDRPSCAGKFWPNQFQVEFARGDFADRPVWARPRVGGEWQEATIKMTPSGFPMAT